MTDALGPVSPAKMRDLVFDLVRRGEIAEAADLAELMMARTGSFQIPPLGVLGHFLAISDRDCEHAYWLGQFRAFVWIKSAAATRPPRGARRTS